MRFEILALMTLLSLAVCEYGGYFGPYATEGTSPGRMYALAVNASNEEVFVAEQREYQTTRTYLTRFSTAQNTWIEMNYTDSYIYHINIVGNKLIIAGSFTRLPSGAACKMIASFENGVWTCLNPSNATIQSYESIQTTVYDSANNRLIIGGNFVAIGGVARKGIVAYYFTNNTVVDFIGMDLTTIYALELDPSGNLYIGGSMYATINISIYYGFMKWNGTSFLSLPGTIANNVYALKWVPALNALAMGGSFATITSQGAPRSSNNFAMLLNNGSYATFPSLLNGEVHGLSLVQGELYITGWFNKLYLNSTAKGVIRYRNGQFQPVMDGLSPAGNSYSYLGMYSSQSSNALYVAGNFWRAFGTCATGLAIYKPNGTAPTPAPTTSPSAFQSLGQGVSDAVNSIVIQDDGKILVGGNFGLTRWNPSTQQYETTGPSALAATLVNSIAVNKTSGNIVVVGDIKNTTYSTQATQFAIYNGTAWNSAIQFSDIPVVTTFSRDSKTIYVGGTFDSFTTGGTTTNAGLIASYSNGVWTNMGNGVSNETSVTVYAIVTDTNGTVYAGGWWRPNLVTECYCLCKWDGVSWSNVSSGVNNDIRTMVWDDKRNILWIGGYFTRTGAGQNLGGFAGWTGSNWITDTAYTVAGLSMGFWGENSDILVLGGWWIPVPYFQYSSLILRNITSGVSYYSDSHNYGPRIFSIAVNGSNVYMGGLLGRIGDGCVSNIAVFTPNLSAQPTPSPTPNPNQPTSTSTSTTGTGSSPTDSGAQLVVMSIALAIFCVLSTIFA